MPTLECLDERSRLILVKLDEMDERFNESFKEFRFAIEERNKLIDERITMVEQDVLNLKLKHAEETGKKSVILWMGGLALTAFASIFGAIGNAVYNWLMRQS